MQVNSSQPPSTHVQQSFAPLLAATSEGEWTAKLLPNTLKALKRTPDATVALLPMLLSSLPAALKLDGSVASLIDALQPLILGPVAPRATLAVSAVAAVRLRGSNSACIRPCACIQGTDWSVHCVRARCASNAAPARPCQPPSRSPRSKQTSSQARSNAPPSHPPSRSLRCRRSWQVGEGTKELTALTPCHGPTPCQDLTPRQDLTPCQDLTPSKDLTPCQGPTACFAAASCRVLCKRRRLDLI